MFCLPVLYGLLPILHFNIRFLHFVQCACQIGMLNYSSFQKSKRDWRHIWLELFFCVIAFLCEINVNVTYIFKQLSAKVEKHNLYTKRNIVRILFLINTSWERLLSNRISDKLSHKYYHYAVNYYNSITANTCQRNIL